MYMKKKILKEDATGVFNTIMVSMVALPTVIYLISQIKKGAKKLMGIEDENRFDKLLKDKEFVKDLTKIIQDEGGIYEFLDKIVPLVANGDWDANNFWSYKSISFAQNVAGKNIPRIIKEILNTPSFKKFAQKEKLSKSDIEGFGNGWYFVLTNPNFRKRYAEMLKNAGEDIDNAYRDMTDKEKRKFFNLDHKINLKNLLPKNK